MRRTLLTPVFIGLLTATAAQCQLVDEYNPPRSTCCLPSAVKTLADQLQDWNQLGRYHAANVELRKQPADPRRVVFMGDSITDIWRLADYFPDMPYVNRGISGQTTPQMLVRMYPDVVDLKPAAMVILAGTNDIARNTGPETAEMIAENLMAMTDIAQRNGIKVVLCSVMPISDYPFLSQQSAQGGRGAAGAPGAPGGGFQNPVLLAGVLYSCMKYWWAVLLPSCSLQIHSGHVARPSCSQMSGHCASVTESPYHMWDSSCTRVASLGM